MKSTLAALALLTAFSVVPAVAQKKGTVKPTEYDITVNADGVYTGTMALTTTGNKVSGDMRITTPGEIVGKVAGTAKGQAMKLDFPYKMVQRGCEGRIVMDLSSPKKGAPLTGKAEITGCGPKPDSKLAATVELKQKK